MDESDDGEGNNLEHAKREVRRLGYAGLAVAMAWGYYIYLVEKLFTILDGFEVIEAFEEHNSVSVFPKLLLILPKSGRTPTFDNVQFVDNLTVCIVEEAATSKRRFVTPIWKLTHPEFGKERPYFLPDMAACLSVLAKMCEDAGAQLTEDLKIVIVAEFIEALKILLESDPKCDPEIYEIIFYDDQGPNAEQFDEVVKKLICATPTPSTVHTCPNSNLVSQHEKLVEGVAYVFYYSYLHTILPELPSKMERWRENQKGHMYPKLLILVPESGRVLRSLRDKKKEIERCTPLDDHFADVGLVRRRPYIKDVWRLTDCRLRFVVEYSTSLLQLSKMECTHPTYRLVLESKQQAVKAYAATLKGLISSDAEHSKICEVILYNDRTTSVADILRRKTVEYEQTIGHPL